MKARIFLYLLLLLGSLQPIVAFEYWGIEYTVLSLEKRENGNVGTCALTEVKRTLENGDFIIPSTVPYEDFFGRKYTLTVVEIGEYAFSGGKLLFSVTIPNTIKTIKGSAFARCTNLTSVDLPNSVTSIGESAFEGCDNLSSVTLSKAITSIGDFAFYECI